MLQIVSDEFDSYINSVQTNFGILHDCIPWLRSRANLFSSITQYVLNLLSISAMSAELKRVFSSAKLTTTPLQNNLSDKTMEVLELLWYWYTRNIISQPRRRRQGWRITRLGNAGEDLTELDNYLSSSSFFAKKSLTKMTWQVRALGSDWWKVWKAPVAPLPGHRGRTYRLLQKGETWPLIMDGMMCGPNKVPLLSSSIGDDRLRDKPVT